VKELGIEEAIAVDSHGGARGRRFSPSVYNDMADVEHVLEALS
jgi:selenocysteine lyase/cysteine desulfurase